MLQTSFARIFLLLLFRFRLDEVSFCFRFHRTHLDLMEMDYRQTRYLNGIWPPHEDERLLTMGNCPVTSRVACDNFFGFAKACSLYLVFIPHSRVRGTSFKTERRAKRETFHEKAVYACPSILIFCTSIAVVILGRSIPILHTGRLQFRQSCVLCGLNPFAYSRTAGVRKLQHHVI